MRIWRKIHIEIDEKTLKIRAAEFITSDVGGAQMLPELLDHNPPEQQIGSVTADGAFDTRMCHDAIAARGAAAIIPPRKMPNHGDPTPQVPSPTTRFCAHPSLLIEPSGDDGLGIIAEAASKQRLIA